MPDQPTVYDPPAETLPESPASVSPEGSEDWVESSEELPVRSRRRLLNPAVLVMLAILLAAVGFAAGAQIEKGETTESSSSGGSGAASLSAAGASAGAKGGATGAKAGAKGAAGALGGAPTVGTVKEVQGNTLYVTNSEGNVVKVTASGSTTVTKSSKVSVSHVLPGESVTVVGSKSPTGAITAQSVTVGTSSASAGARGALGGALGAAGGAGGAGGLPGGGPPGGGPPGGGPPGG